MSLSREEKLKRIEELKRERERVEQETRSLNKTFIGLLSDAIGSLITENIKAEYKGSYFNKSVNRTRNRNQ